VSVIPFVGLVRAVVIVGLVGCVCFFWDELKEFWKEFKELKK